MGVLVDKERTHKFIEGKDQTWVLGGLGQFDGVSLNESLELS